MNRPPDAFDAELDRILETLRETTPDPTRETAAVDRVWPRIAAEIAAADALMVRPRHLRGCADVQALIPGYLAGEVPEARRLLLEDHVGECVPCRRALKQARPARTGRNVARIAAQPSTLAAWGWRAAAAAVIVLAVYGLSFRTEIFSFEAGGLVHIEALDGQAFRMTEAGSVPIAAGESLTLAPGETLRTAKGSAAVLRLADESQVEMRERSELGVRERRSFLPGTRPDAVLALDRGSVIVEASPQGSGHLHVDTADCQVAVTGTVFAVNHGMKGSRVSVLEGEVRVQRRGDRSVLEPGGQLTTTPFLARVPLERDFAWSQNDGRYLELARQLHAVGREMDAVLGTELRHATDLLELVPAETAVYVAIPNVSGGLAEAWTILQQRVGSQDVLREWWQHAMVDSGAEGDLRQVIDRIRTYGEQLGDEVVVTLRVREGHEPEPLVLARLRQPEAFAEFIGTEVERLGSTLGQTLRVELLEGSPLPAWPEAGAEPDAEAEPTLYLWRRGDLLIATPVRDGLREYAAALAAGQTLGAVGDPFHARLSELYGQGVEWLLGVDIARFIRAGDPQDASATTLDELGLLDAQHLIIEHRRQGERFENRGVLTFDQPRRGVAAWLAPPAPSAALKFVSADANVAAAFVVKDLDAIVDELFQLLERTDPEFRSHLEQFEREHGVSVREDFAAPLGGEFAVALDGPVLPIPSWKLIVEVYDPVRLQRTLSWVVDQLNQLAARDGRRGLTLVRQELGGREFYELTSLDHGMLSLSYVFEGGFLVAAPSRALLDRALQVRELELSLADSARFTALLPQDGEMNFSAVVYQNVQPILGGLTQGLGRVVQGLSPEQQRLMQTLEQESGPSLALVYGERDRIVFVGTSESGLLSGSLSSFFSVGGLMNVQQSLRRAAESGGAAEAADPPTASAGDTRDRS